MPWKAVPFDEASVRQRLSQHFSVMGIPTLVVVGADGRVLTANGRSAVMRDPQGRSYPWEGETAGWDGWVPHVHVLCGAAALLAPAWQLHGAEGQPALPARLAWSCLAHASPWLAAVSIHGLRSRRATFAILPVAVPGGQITTAGVQGLAHPTF
jgi:hypothetical protein